MKIPSVPTMYPVIKIDESTTQFSSYYPLPTLGAVPINSYLINSTEPTIIDSSIECLENEYFEQLESVIDPKTIKWIFITHTDADHVGNLHKLLQKAPDAKIVTTYLGMGKMSLLNLPMDRIFLLNPDQEFDIGDRKLKVSKPITFDAPETCCFYDNKTRNYFSADSFGALLTNVYQSSDDIPDEELKNGINTWASIDSPWLANYSADQYLASLKRIQQLNINYLLSSHLPVTKKRIKDVFLYAKDNLKITPFVGPDQKTFEALLSSANKAA